MEAAAQIAATMRLKQTNTRSCRAGAAKRYSEKCHAWPLTQEAGLVFNSPGHPQTDTFRSRSALPITDTELRLMAALAIIGLKRMPKNGYRIPIATGTPRKL